MKMRNLSKEDHSMKYRMTPNATTKDAAEHLEQQQHQKRLHRTIKNSTAFICHKCISEFRQEAA